MINYQKVLLVAGACAGVVALAYLGLPRLFGKRTGKGDLESDQTPEEVGSEMFRSPADVPPEHCTLVLEATVAPRTLRATPETPETTSMEVGEMDTKREELVTPTHAASCRIAIL